MLVHHKLRLANKTARLMIVVSTWVVGLHYMSTGKRDLRVYWSQTSKAMNNLTPSDESKPNRTKSETATLFRSIRLGHAKFTLSVRAGSACHFCDYYSTLVSIEYIFLWLKVLFLYISYKSLIVWQKFSKGNMFLVYTT